MSIDLWALGPKAAAYRLCLSGFALAEAVIHAGQPVMRGGIVGRQFRRALKFTGSFGVVLRAVERRTQALRRVPDRMLKG